MGLFSTLFGRSRETVVQIAFRPLDRDLGNHNREGYSYKWTLKQQPEIGMRVIVPGIEGPAPAIVIGFGRGAGAKGMTLKQVTRLATAAEIKASHAKTAAERDAWLSMARRAAGMPTRGRVRRNLPENYPAIPPADGAASAKQADEWGRGWWRIAKRAEEYGRDPDEVKRFQSIAHRWFAIRDREAK